MAAAIQSALSLLEGALEAPADQFRPRESRRVFRLHLSDIGEARFLPALMALLLGRDGRIHLAYTWRRQGIKYATFSEAWLDGAAP